MSAPVLEPPPPAAPRRVAHAGPKRTSGEAKVWLTSVGLSIGLLMVAGLLYVIVANGIAVFWPARVVRLEIKADAAFAFEGQKQLTGAIVKRQEKAAVDARTRAAALARGERLTELQLYVGNKDAWGQNFVFVDESAVAATSYPRDIMVIERVEYGNAIGTPVALRAKDGTETRADEPGFFGRLEAAAREVNARRVQIKRIEKDRIGAINEEMEKLKLEQRAQPPEKIAAGEQTLKALQTEYEAFAKQATELRERQGDLQLAYLLPTGIERSVSVGQIVSFYHPNQLTLSQRIGWFAHNLWTFLTDEPREANTEGGIFPAIFGTFVMTLLMSAAVVPFGVVAAIYLREYARQGFAVRAVRIAVNNLAGVPSIVFGVFGLGFFVYLVGGTVDRFLFSLKLPTPTFGTGGILWAALTLALMTVPVVIVATEEALSAVPRGMREASLACGASKWQTIQHIVLPGAIPGILTGLILAMARGAGEVAPLMLVGVVKLAPSLPLDFTAPFIHMERKFMHLGFHIYDLGFQSPDSEAAKPMVFATTFLLILLVVLLNLGAILIRERIRRKYKTAAF
jgi:phosphate transport system permease protein